MIEAPKGFSEQTGFPVEIPDQCRRCVTLARFAAKHAGLSEQIQAEEEAGISGELTNRWINQIAKVGEMNVDEATAFVSSNEPRLRAEFIERLQRMDRAREDQTSFAQYVIAHCGSGVIHMTSATKGVAVEAEICGSTTPEHVHGFDDAEIVRVNRSPSIGATD